MAAAEGGLNKGDLTWRRPNRVTLSNLLHNPIYAGAYVYGRRPIDPRRKIDGGRLEIDNNLTEQEIKPLGLLEKTSCFVHQLRCSIAMLAL